MSFGEFLTRMFRYFKIPIMDNAALNSVFTGSYFESLYLKFQNDKWLHKSEYLALRTLAQHFSTPPPHTYCPLFSPPTFEPPSSTSTQPIHTPHSTASQDSFGQMLLLVQKLYQIMDKIEERQVKIMKDMKSLSRRIDCIDHGQLLGMTFAIQSQYNAYKLQHMIEFESESELDKDRQEQDRETSKVKR